MDIKISEIREAINEAWMDYKNDMGQSTSKPYEAKDQWEDEIKIFMNGLKSGDFIEFGEKSIGVEWRQGSNSNDPRFIVFEFGDNRLRDDHFSMQHSRSLTDDELKDIRDVMVRMGMVDKYEFDMEYNLNMGQFYESRVDRAIRKVISEAMYHKFPDDEKAIKKLIGRKPKSLRARQDQVYKLCNEYYGLDKKTYDDNGWAAIGKYKSAIESLGCDVTIYPCANLDKPTWDIQSDGGYCDYDPNDHMPRSKQYKLEISYPDGMVIEGYIKCMAAGSMDDPFDRYDTCMVLWGKAKRRYDEQVISRLVKENVGRLLREWDPDDPDEDWSDHVEEKYSPHEFVGLYDLSTDEIYYYEEPIHIEVASDPFKGRHKYVYFHAYPRYNVYEDPGDYWTPGSLDIDIYDYDISVDDFTYTTVDDDGYAYYEDYENTKEPFGGLTDEQMKKIKKYLDGLNLDDWGFFD